MKVCNLNDTWPTMFTNESYWCSSDFYYILIPLNSREKQIWANILAPLRGHKATSNPKLIPQHDAEDISSSIWLTMLILKKKCLLVFPHMYVYMQ